MLKLGNLKINKNPEISQQWAFSGLIFVTKN